MARPWQHKVNVAAFFRNDDLTFEQRRDGVVKLLKEWREAHLDLDPDGDLDLLVDELAEVDDHDSFDCVWDAIYDWADVDKRLWIDTMSRQAVGA